MESGRRSISHHPREASGPELVTLMQEDSLEVFVFVLETIRTGAMRVIHIPVKTEETQRLRIKFCTVLSYLCTQLENQTS